MYYILHLTHLIILFSGYQFLLLWQFKNFGVASAKLTLFDKLLDQYYHWSLWGSEQLGNFDEKVVITPYHKKQFIIMQIIIVSLNLKFKNIICSSCKYLGLYGASVPLLFSNLITGKDRILFLLKGGGGTSSSLYAVLVKIFIKIKF